MRRLDEGEDGRGRVLAASGAHHLRDAHANALAISFDEHRGQVIEFSRGRSARARVHVFAPRPGRCYGTTVALGNS